MSYVAIPEQTTDCGTSQKTGAESSLDNWTRFLTTHPGLEASSQPNGRSEAAMR